MNKTISNSPLEHVPGVHRMESSSDSSRRYCAQYRRLLILPGIKNVCMTDVRGSGCSDGSEREAPESFSPEETSQNRVQIVIIVVVKIIAKIIIFLFIIIHPVGFPVRIQFVEIPLPVREIGSLIFLVLGEQIFFEFLSFLFGGNGTQEGDNPVVENRVFFFQNENSHIHLDVFMQLLKTEN